MRFVNVEIKLGHLVNWKLPVKTSGVAHLVPLLEFHNCRDVAHTAFHAVQSFDNKQDFLPGAVSPRLALANTLAQELFQVLHVIMPECPYHRPTEADPDTD